MKGRTVPPSKEEARIAALRSGSVAAVRAWAQAHRVTLFGDDAMLLYSIHDARAVMPEASDDERAASLAWLAAHAPPA